MLMNKIRSTYRGITGYIEPAAPVCIIPGQRSAANTANIIDSDMQARSQRRRRRSGQNGLSNVSGWTVRTW